MSCAQAPHIIECRVPQWHARPACVQHQHVSYMIAFKHRCRAPSLRGESRTLINDQGQQTGHICSFPAQTAQRDTTSLPVTWVRRVNPFAVRIVAIRGIKTRLQTFLRLQCLLAGQDMPHNSKRHTRSNLIHKRPIHIRHQVTHRIRRRGIRRRGIRRIRKHPAHQHRLQNNNLHLLHHRRRRQHQNQPVTLNLIQWLS